MHYQNHILAVHVASVVYFTSVVREPPPELFLRNPVRYASAVQNATGIVLLEAMRHVGLPTLEWMQCAATITNVLFQPIQCARAPVCLSVRACARCRSARKCAGAQIDKLHALAFHEYRATHKTKSQVISLLHLVSIYGTHPELRPWLHASQSAVLVKFAQYLDRMMEKRNDFAKERNTSRLSIFNSLHFTPLLTAMQHVRQTFRLSQLSQRGDDDGVRPSMVNEITSLVRFFEEEIGESPVCKLL